MATRRKTITESERVELKKSTALLKEAVISIGAMLNKHRAGTLYFGVRDNGVPVGLNVSEATLREVAEGIGQHIEPKIYPAVEKVVIDNKQCVRVRFTGDDVLYYAYGRAYSRVGTTDKLISARELEKQVVRKHRVDNPWDQQASDWPLTDFKAGLVRKYLARARAAGRVDYGFSSVRNALTKLGFYKRGKVRRGAELLFGKSSPTQVQAAIFAGTNKVKFLDIKLFAGDLFTLIRESELYLTQHLKWEVKIEAIEREEIPEIPIAALREAIVNSLCHRDYYRPENNEVAIFADRVEIYNPGQFTDEHDPMDYIRGEEHSILRNPTLAQALYYVKEIERFGSGLKRIYDECSRGGVKVEFKRLKSGFVVIFYRPTRVKGKGADRGADRGVDRLPDNAVKIYALIKADPKISRPEIMRKGSMSKKTVEYNLKVLKKRRAIARKGPAFGGYWVALVNRTEGTPQRY